MHFVVEILSKKPAYETIRRARVQYHQGHTVKLHRDSLEVFQGPDSEFYGRDAGEATQRALYYFSRFFGHLETRLGVVLVKDRAQNIRLVSQHYARVGDPAAVRAEASGERVRVFAHDGRLSFVCDHSLREGPPEAETVHPEEAQDDMATYHGFITDLLEKKPMTLSQVQGAVSALVVQFGRLARAQEDLTGAVRVLAESQGVASKQVETVASSLSALLGGVPMPPEPPGKVERPPYVG